MHCVAGSIGQSILEAMPGRRPDAADAAVAVDCSDSAAHIGAVIEDSAAAAADLLVVPKQMAALCRDDTLGRLVVQRRLGVRHLDNRVVQTYC